MNPKMTGMKWKMTINSLNPTKKKAHLKNNKEEKMR